MSFRPQTHGEQSLYDECVAWGRKATRWQDYARRIRSEREALRRALREAPKIKPLAWFSAEDECSALTEDSVEYAVWAAGPDAWRLEVHDHRLSETRPPRRHATREAAIAAAEAHHRARVLSLLDT